MLLASHSLKRIVKHIARTHGGTISVESKFGEGSTFSIFLLAS